MNVYIRPNWEVLHRWSTDGSPFPYYANSWETTGRWQIVDGNILIEIRTTYSSIDKWSWRKFKWVEQPDIKYLNWVKEEDMIVTESSEIFTCGSEL